MKINNRFHSLFRLL